MYGTYLHFHIENILKSGIGIFFSLKKWIREVNPDDCYITWTNFRVIFLYYVHWTVIISKWSSQPKTVSWFYRYYDYDCINNHYINKPHCFVYTKQWWIFIPFRVINHGTIEQFTCEMTTFSFNINRTH